MCIVYRYSIYDDIYYNYIIRAERVLLHTFIGKGNTNLQYVYNILYKYNNNVFIGDSIIQAGEGEFFFFRRRCCSPVRKDETTGRRRRRRRLNIRAKKSNDGKKIVRKT